MKSYKFDRKSESYLSFRLKRLENPQITTKSEQFS